LRGAVIRISEYGCLVLHGVDGAINILSETSLDVIHDLTEMVELFGVHIGLALLDFVRGDGFVWLYRHCTSPTDKIKVRFNTRKRLLGQLLTFRQ
jgi:hypothetical protein